MSMVMNIASVALDKSVQDYGNRTAIVGEGLSVSYKSLGQRVNAAGRALLNLGCQAGDRVLIALPDSLEFTVAFFALLKIGAIPVPVSPYVSSQDYSHYLTDTDARFAIVHASTVPSIYDRELIAITVGSDLENAKHLCWERLVEHSSCAALEPYPTPADKVALLAYTSGSTNRQKCVMHSSIGMAMACCNVGLRTFGFGPEDRILSVSKPFFSFGLGFGVLFPIFAGASTIVTSKRTDLKDVVEFIRIYRPTVLCAVPSFLSVLLNARNWLTVDLSSIRLIASAGEPLGIRLYEGFRDAFNIEVVDGIGSTEMMTHFISNRPGRSHPASCGLEVPDCEVALVDDEGRPVSSGEIGKLMIKGPTRFIGYWRDPEATMRVRSGEWVFTGDNFYRDENGYYYFCGRNDDMLKVAGVWVIPQEVEAVLCQHPHVASAFVTTREDAAGRRRLIAYIVPQNTAIPTNAELLTFVGARVAEHMIPAAFVMLSAMPLTSNGKVNRKALPMPKWQSAQCV